MFEYAESVAAEPTILHADLDAFYASVEQLLDPALRGKPIAVGGGVVLAASYEAKRLGVTGGMSGRRARELCPQLRFVGGHFSEYQRLGDQVIDILRDFTPIVERISIDEAFLDVGGALKLFGSSIGIAATIRRRVRSEVGLPISIGVAGTKHLAKIASQVAKPDGLVVVPIGKEREFLDPLPVALIWGVGPKTQAKLAERGIRTIGELAATPGRSLKNLLGNAVGDKLSSLADNIDPRGVESGRRASSVGAQAALGRKTVTPQLLQTTLGYLADRVAGRLRAAGRAGRTITVRVRFADMRSVTRSTTLSGAISATSTLTEVAVDLARVAFTDHPTECSVSLLAISVSHLTDQSTLQLELGLGLGDDARRPGSTKGEVRWVADRSADAVRLRFGRDAIGYASVFFSDVGHVPDEFRELAEGQGLRPATKDERRGATS
jgi:DNA polymerase-4